MDVVGAQKIMMLSLDCRLFHFALALTLFKDAQTKAFHPKLMAMEPKKFNFTVKFVKHRRYEDFEATLNDLFTFFDEFFVRPRCAIMTKFSKRKLLIRVDEIRQRTNIIAFG